MSTKVRLTDAEVYPDHGKPDSSHGELIKPDVWARYRGIEMQQPEIERGLSPYGYVCRHQIQAGD